MIDGECKPWLIEVNSNPCPEISCPLLSEMIPLLIENTLRIGVDSVAPPPANFKEKRPRFTEHALSSNEYELVFDSTQEGEQ